MAPAVARSAPQPLARPANEKTPARPIMAPAPASPRTRHPNTSSALGVVKHFPRPRPAWTSFFRHASRPADTTRGTAPEHSLRAQPPVSHARLAGGFFVCAPEVGAP